MRPGLNAPDNPMYTFATGELPLRFNEAGAECPG